MMMEQVDVPAGAAAASVSLGRALSDEARASLEAVRVAQEAGRLRARRQTVRARIGLAAMVGVGGLLALVLVPRVAGGRYARVQAPATARPAPIAPEPPAQWTGAPTAGAGSVAAAPAPVAVAAVTAAGVAT